MNFKDLIRDTILRRRQAYRAVFMPGGNMDSAAVKTVLSDLRRFCRGTSTPAMVSPQSGMIDPIATGIAIGRQEVFHRICQHLHLTDADLYKLVEHNEGE